MSPRGTEETRGSYYSGPARVSLIDTAGRAVLNTIAIEDSEGHDEFDLPYRIRTGDYYHTTTISRIHETQPILMWLNDYNGDGKSLEFALFDAEACMGLPTTLIGYTPDLDRVVHYPIRISDRPDGHGNIHSSYWLDYLFHRMPDRPGHWKYEINYCGRSVTPKSCDGFFEVTYDTRTEQFNATVIWIDAAPSARRKKPPD